MWRGVARSVAGSAARPRARLVLAAATLATTGTVVTVVAPDDVTVAQDAGDCGDESPLGAAGVFAEFVQTDSQRVSATEGRVAVGRRLTVTGEWSVGSQTDGFDGGDLELVVGGAIDLQARLVVDGGASYLALDGPDVIEADPSLVQPPPLDIDEEFEGLRLRSQSWAGLAPNGTTTLLPFPDRVEMTGTDPVLNVFVISGAELARATEWYLRVPAGSTTLVNVESAGTLDLAALTSLFIWDEAAGRYVIDAAAAPGVAPSPQYASVRSRLVWNLPDVTALRKGPSAWPGTLLAPRASMAFGEEPSLGPGIVNGSVIVRALTSAPGATTTNWPFLGCLPVPLVVEKVIDGPAAGTQGQVVVEVACDSGSTATWTIPAGTASPPPFTVDGLRSGTTCTVTETVDGSRPGLAVTVDPPGSQTVVVGGTGAVARITNTYSEPPPPDTRLVVEMAYTGDAVGEQGPAELWVRCGDAVRERRTIPAGATSAGPFVFGPVPPATPCVVSEVPDGDTAEVGVEVSGLGTVVTPTSGDAVATLTHEVSRRAGRLRVTASFTGGAVGQQGPITVRIDCAPGPSGIEEVVPAGAVTPVTFVVDPVPAGAVCDVTESGGAAPGISVATVGPPIQDVVVDAGSTVDVEIVTAVVSGGLVVSKRAEGEHELRGPVTIEVDCDGEPLVTRTWQSGEVLAPLFVAPLAPGTPCTVTETADGAIPGLVGAVVGGDLDPVTRSIDVVVPADEPLVVRAVNSYTSEAGALVVTTEVGGQGAALRGTIGVDVSCSDGTEASAVYAPGDPLTPLVVAPLPDGTSCTVVESPTGAGPDVDVVTTFAIENGVAGVVPLGTTPRVTVQVGGGLATGVTITNRYTAVGSIEAVVSLSGPAVGQQGPIVVAIVCGGDRVAAEVLPSGATGPLTVRVDRVPVGSSCAVVQVTDGSTSTVDAAVSGIPAGPVVVAAGTTTVPIETVLTTAPGRFVVVTRITGPEADRRGTVEVDALCLGPDGVTTAAAVYDPGDELVPLVVGPLASGTVCVAFERRTGANADASVSVAIRPGPLASISPGADSEVVIVNDYRQPTGRVFVDKSVVGSAAGARGGIELRVECDDGTEVSAVFAPGQPVAPFLVSGIAGGASCTISEPSTGQVPGVAVATEFVPGDRPTVDAGATARVRVVNEYSSDAIAPTVPTTTPGVVSTTTTLPTTTLPPTTRPGGQLPGTGGGPTAATVASLLTLHGAALLIGTPRRPPRPGRSPAP